MSIETARPLLVVEGSLVAHPNFERYLKASTLKGALPLRVDLKARSQAAAMALVATALGRLCMLAAEERAELQRETVVASCVAESGDRWRVRVLAIARRNVPEVERVVVQVEADL